MILKELTEEQFFSFYSDLRTKYFSDTLSYSVMDVRDAHEMALTASLKTKLVQDSLYLGVYTDKDELMGWSVSYQAKVLELYTQNSAVIPEFRRKGVYSLMQKHVLKVAKERGYQMVTSHHVASNNSVIMAKLKLGFMITGFELCDDFGALVKLTNYLNETRSRAYQVRTGLKRPDQDIKDLLKI